MGLIRTNTVIRFSYIAGQLILILALFQLSLVLIAKMPSSVFVLYISAIASKCAVGIFLILWKCRNMNQIKNKTSSQLILILFFLFFLARAVISGKMVVALINGQHDDLVYYVTEVLVWVTLSAFLAMEFRMSFAAKTASHHRSRFRKIGIAIAIISAVRAVVSLHFMLVCFRPRGLRWMYYLAETVMWLSLVIFFTMHSHSKFAISPRRRHHRHRQDPELEKALECAAKYHDNHSIDSHS